MTEKSQEVSNIILEGNALEQLKKLPDESINCVMTSPPYWALRDYGVEGQLGLEPTFEEYINKLCNIFEESKRVLRDDGTCWVNLGDTYGGSGGASGHTEETKNLGYKTKSMGAVAGGSKTAMAKSLTMIPMRFAIEMVNRGWILRNTIIWHKPNCMPSSVKDRFTVDFEYIFFFTKNKKYWFETQREPVSPNSDFKKKVGKDVPYAITGNNNLGKGSRGSSKGRNKRAVWTINPKPFKESHFAVYPEELCETPIKAGCPEFVCKKCGNPKILFQEREKQKKELTRESKKVLLVRPDGYSRPPTDWKEDKIISQELKPTCNCNEGFTEGIVLDPFFGAGTTGLVALKQNKKFIGIELNPEYIEIANKRLKPYLEQRKL